jgi:hypothetical protein
MNLLEKPVKMRVRTMYYLAGAAVVLMMVLTCVDIAFFCKRISNVFILSALYEISYHHLITI